MSIKKAYEEIIGLLEANPNKKVSSIIAEARAMCAQKTNLKTFAVDAEGQVYAIYCYYHKHWELLSEVEYGLKASSTTGFNTMCKVGVSKWTKQNNAVKAVNGTVLEMLEKGELELADIEAMKEQLIAQAREIDTTDMPIGYETLEIASLDVIKEA